MTDYQPIACSLHDRMEAAAVRRTTVRLRWRSETGPEVSEGLIQDIVVRDGAEYLLLGEGLEIRLDHIEDLLTVESGNG